MRDESTARGGIGFWGQLAILFITLKLCGVIQWPWVWVLAPLWGPVAFVSGLLLALVLGLAIKLGALAVIAACNDGDDKPAKPPPRPKPSPEIPPGWG
ncbi:MAG: hypothetical protein L0211_07430 [Planctomycetaceae bacterium]|nr:hypothetical protein [Planctomycetaceae bacterium]